MGTGMGTDGPQALCWVLDPRRLIHDIMVLTDTDVAGEPWPQVLSAYHIQARFLMVRQSHPSSLRAN